MILATHEMSFAREVADSIAFLHEGRIIEQGDPEKVLSDPAEPGDPPVPPPPPRRRPDLTCRARATAPTSVAGGRQRNKPLRAGAGRGFGASCAGALARQGAWLAGALMHFGGASSSGSSSLLLAVEFFP